MIDAESTIEDVLAENARLKEEIAFLKEPPPPCRYCKKPATRYCDYRVARCKQTGEELICSAPICESPACGWQEEGAIFFCGGHNGCEVDHTDFCKDHRGSSFGGPPPEVVSRTKLYAMENQGLGLILLKEKGPELVV